MRSVLRQERLSGLIRPMYEMATFHPSDEIGVYRYRPSSGCSQQKADTSNFHVCGSGKVYPVRKLVLVVNEVHLAQGAAHGVYRQCQSQKDNRQKVQGKY